MSTPADAQKIEAAAKAMFVAASINENPAKDWEEIVKMPQHILTVSHYRNQATVALTAAAGVAPKDRYGKTWFSYKHVQDAVLAERERCAQVARKWGANVHVGPVMADAIANDILALKDESWLLVQWSEKEP